MPPDVMIIQWMLIRAQNNYGTNLFDPAYTLSESGSLDNQTGLAIKAIIKYHKSGIGFSILTPKPTDNILMSPFLDPNAVIFPDDTNYIFLLKCSLAPICVTQETKQKIDFNDDPLVKQALGEKIIFAAFTTAAEAKDGTNCATTDGSSPYYTIDAGIVLEADAIVVLDKIGPLYFAKTKTKFNVNSGTRSAYRQAAALYTVYMSGDKILSQYSRWKANEMISVIKKGESETVTVQKMAEVIQKYFDKGTLFSDHQQAGAIDISIVGDVGVPRMTGPQQKIMMDIAKQVTSFSAILEQHPPHIHIKFK